MRWMQILVAIMALGCAEQALPVTPQPKPAFKEWSLTEDDRDQIEAIVKSLTDDPIMDITITGADTVEVMTGVVRGPLDGGGRYFDFKRVRGRWEYTQENGLKMWVS